MSSPESPHFIVRRHDPAALRRRRVGLVLAAIIALVVIGGGGFAFGRYSAPRARAMIATPPLPAPVASANRILAQQVATLKKSQQVAQVAATDLRKTLAAREREISGLRADVAFYSRLVGSGERSSGLAVYGVQLKPIKGSRAYAVTIILTGTVRRGSVNRGVVQVSVDGVRGGQLRTLADANVGAGKTGLPYAFKYFQQLHTTVKLPPRFVPRHLRIAVQPRHGKQVQRTLTWADALHAPTTATTP